MQNTNRVNVETTNRVNGCLEAGAVCGHVTSYDRAELAEVLRVQPTDLPSVVQHSALIGPADNHCTVGEWIRFAGLKGRTVRRGTVIA